MPERVEVDLEEIGDDRLDVAAERRHRGVEAGLARERVRLPDLGHLVPRLWRAALLVAAREVRVLRVEVQRPDEVVERDDAARAAALGLEGVEAVPRADVEDRLAPHVGEVDVGELLAQDLGRLAALGADAVAEVDRVPPVATEVVQPGEGLGTGLGCGAFGRLGFGHGGEA